MAASFDLSPLNSRRIRPLNSRRSRSNGAPENFNFWGEWRVLSPNNAGVILCDLHTEREITGSLRVHTEIILELKIERRRWEKIVL